VATHREGEGRGGRQHAGECSLDAGRLVGYAAEGTHSCVKRALDVIGLGSDALRLVPVTEAAAK